MSVNFKDKDYEENIDYLNIVNDLYKGTRKIKESGSKYLRQHYLESNDAFNVRLEDSTLYNFFQKSVNNLSSVLLRKAPKLDYKVRFEGIINNIDGKGSSLNSFMKEASKQALKDGLCYIWTDSQRTEGTISMSNIDNIQPYLKLIKRSDVINKSVVFEGGKAILKQIVIKQNISVQEDEFKSTDKEVYIVLRENEGLIYEEVKKDTFEIIDKWVSDLGYVPVAPVYSAKTDFLEADIPLLDLAYLNLSHYNIQSNLSSTLVIATVPIAQMFTQNAREEETISKNDITVGVGHALSFESKTEEGFKWEEMKGTSIKPLETNIEKIEERMEKLALSVLSSTSFNTATEAKISDSNSNLFLKELSYSLESAINASFSIMGDYLGQEVNITLELNKDFDSIGLDSNAIDKYISLKREGLISLDTLWNELIKGEVLSIEDYDLEKQKIEEELNRL